jgi:predicted amidophosphoribosyltransferase
MIRCGYCCHEFAEEAGIHGCGRCGRATACRNVRCPRCLYENPPEPVLLKKLKKLLPG